ncbi:SCAN domain-containing protein 3-like [Oopsacas minuta]|uniref:SCAN domain-containing protein 3-like n=1 Tax=Oopsacas minuta TaxID=111878 RepID=A0AAV7JHG5_9METZ|nr:SCAN domain-containing protein 3-like [Oopsacas minuta]
MTENPKKKCRQYSIDYLKFGFIASPTNQQLPFCLLCNQVFSNEGMKPSRMCGHLTKKYPDKKVKDLKYFPILSKQFANRGSIDGMINKITTKNDDGLVASYNISLLIAKCGKPRTIGEKLILPAIREVISTVIHQDASSVVRSIPLSNNSVSRKIEELAIDVEQQLCKVLQTTEFALQLDESTLRDNKALLMAYVRYIHNGVSKEEMLFSKPLETDPKVEFLEEYDSTLAEKVKMIRTDVAYLPDIFEKLNIVNKQLQGNNTTLIQAKGVVLSFLSKLTLFRQNIARREFGQLPCSSELDMANNNIIRDDNIHIYCSHVDSLSEDLLIRSKDLTELVIPNFVINPFRTNIETLDPQFQEEFTDLQNDIEYNAIFAQCGYSAFWMKKEVSERYPHIFQTVKLMFVAFPSSYLVEKGFSTVVNLPQNKEIDWK